MSDYFVDHGFWFADKDTAQDKITEIRSNDRIAIKRMVGRGADEVAIHAIGIVEDVQKHPAMDFMMVYVQWVRLPEDPRVPFGGFGGTIYGPFSRTEKRMADIFML